MQSCCCCYRPFDPTKATNSTGSWCWVGLPKSVLINGRGNYHDCEDPYKRVVSAAQQGTRVSGGPKAGASLDAPVVPVMQQAVEHLLLS